jgi:hypothetical protein
MFGSEELTRELLDVLRIQAQAVLETAAANRKLLKRHRPKTSRKAAPRPLRPRPYQPQNKEFRDWNRFRAHMVEIELIVRERKQLEPHDKVTLDMMYEWGGPTKRTAERIMDLTYGLPSDMWPPSTWPEDLPPKT